MQDRTIAGGRTDDERAIRDLVETWMSASNRGDVEAVLSLMDDNVIFMTPGGAPFGKEKFKAGLESMRGVKMEARADIQEVEVLGDWAWLRNHIDLTITPEGGEPRHRSGYTLTILRKAADGHWRLHRDANLLS
jgi:uncharacterized protein (TIGR02246 family)